MRLILALLPTLTCAAVSVDESAALTFTGFPRVADLSVHDGGLRPAIGVSNIQVVRANRSDPSAADGTAYTYKHAPMLCHWQGHFYLSYLNGPTGEHEAPCPTMITRSPDGLVWECPRLAFDCVEIPGRGKTVTHQRMGFYLTRDGTRLLALAFLGFLPNPNDGTGLGRMVREVHADGTLGPIYAIRFNPGFSAANTPFKPYSAADDAGFRAACEELLGNRLMVQQWLEEDQLATDGLYVAGPKPSVLKAFCWYTLPDQRILGLWKDRLYAIAGSWEPGQVPVASRALSFSYAGAKAWGQQTADGRYALVSNPTGMRWQRRYPLAVATSGDGLAYDQGYLAVHGELNPPRFAGNFKDSGPQYVRGIEEGNGRPPDGAMWLTYSVNKEDIWVSRVPAPIIGTAADRGPIRDSFVGAVGPVVPGWNVYSPLWAPVAVKREGQRNVLSLSDRDPYDYAKAVRVFPVAVTATVAFDVRTAAIGHDGLAVELVDQAGRRPVRLWLAANQDEWRLERSRGAPALTVKQPAKAWTRVTIAIDAGKATYRVSLNQRIVVDNEPLVEVVRSVERLEFRTGGYRLRDTTRLHGYGFPITDDLPAPDSPITESAYHIADVAIDIGQRGDVRGFSFKAGRIEPKPGLGYAADRILVEAKPYTDQEESRLTAVPDDLVEAHLLRTPNKDAAASGDQPLVQIDLAGPATVTIAYRAEAQRLPAWLTAEWQPRSGELVASAPVAGGKAITFRLFSRQFEAGQVVLPGNDGKQTGAQGNYVVIIKGQ